MAKITIIIENELGRETVVVEQASHIEFEQYHKSRIPHWEAAILEEPELEIMKLQFKPHKKNGSYLRVRTERKDEMSADNGLFVQRNAAGKYVVQEGSMSADNLPDPEEAAPEQTFRTLEKAINENRMLASQTEYGFVFPEDEQEAEAPVYDEVPAPVLEDTEPVEVPHVTRLDEQQNKPKIEGDAS